MKFIEDATDDETFHRGAFRTEKSWAKQREWKRYLYRQFKEMHELASNGTYSPTWDQWQAANDKAAAEAKSRRTAVTTRKTPARNRKGWNKR